MARQVKTAADYFNNDAPSCAGKSRAWGSRYRGEEHPAYRQHPVCKNCHADLGCVRCSGPTYELLCMGCKDWGHEDALNEHGRLLNTPEERAEALNFLRSLIAGVKNVP